MRRQRRQRGREPGSDGDEGRGASCARARAWRQRLDSRALDRRWRRPGSRAARRCLQPRSRCAAIRGRPVLRDGRSRVSRRRCGDGDAPSVGRAAMGQAVLRIRRAPLAGRAWHQPVGSERARELGPQRALVSHACGRRDLDARQVGVSVVRCVGPGVSLRAAVARRRRLRQGADRAAAAHALHASERADPGVRVELQRCQPAGHRVGGAVRLRARGRDPRRGRSRVPCARVRPPAERTSPGG